MKIATRLIRSTVLLAGAFFVSSTLACTTTAWTSAEAGTNADDPTNGIPRVSGFCGLEVTGTGHVVDNSPADEATFIARFYVFPTLLPVGTHELFAAFSVEDDIGSDMFEITYNGTSISIDATGAGGGTASAPADLTHWNLVEVLWTSGGQGGLWVNSDSTVDDATVAFDSGTGSIDQVRLGAVSSIGTDMAFFDDYESHRSLPVGPLLAGDGNFDGNINSGDIDMVVNEFLFSDLANGVVDCNLDGSINSGDIDCVVSIFLGL
jgi:hypothetical protein